MNNKYFLIALLLLIVSCISTSETNKIPIREDIEWLDVWITNNNDFDLPKVLLIGNSITRSYYKNVESALDGKAYVSRLTTSKSIGDQGLLDEIELVLKSSQFDLVHFNNGLHGWGYSENEYREAFPIFIHTIETYASGAKLIWASTTPMREGENMEDFDPLVERIKERNTIALEFIQDREIAYNDLFAFMEPHPEYYAGSDGTHLVTKGIDAISNKVVEVITETLNTSQSYKNK